MEASLQFVLSTESGVIPMTSDQDKTSGDPVSTGGGTVAGRSIKNFFRRKQKSSRSIDVRLFDDGATGVDVGGGLPPPPPPPPTSNPTSPSDDFGQPRLIVSTLASSAVRTSSSSSSYGNYYTVSGTTAGVLHDQFSRRYRPSSQVGAQPATSGRSSRSNRLRRSTGGATLPSTSRADGDAATDDAGRTGPDEMTASGGGGASKDAGRGRFRGYFRWRHKSAPEHVIEEDAQAQRRSNGNVGGVISPGSLTGAAAGRVRNWFDSFRQRTRSEGVDGASCDDQRNAAAAVDGGDPQGGGSSRSKRKKFKVTPALPSVDDQQNYTISEMEFNEMIRTRANSDPCFEAWLKAKEAVSRSRKLSESSKVKGRNEPHYMVIWRDKKRGTKVFRMPRTCEDNPSIEGVTDDGSDDLVYARLMNNSRCYDLMPNGSKLVVFDTQLTVKKAFFALVANGVRAAPLWDTRRQDFVGMLTITDFIQILQKYYKSPQERMDEVEEQQIATWREVLGENDRPVVRVDPDDTLLTTMRRLRENHVHRVLVVDNETGNALHILTHKRILRYLYTNMHELPQPSFMDKTLGELNIGSYDDIATARHDTPLIEALNMFVERTVSALPIIDNDGRVVDVYAKFDVIGLAEEKLYNNLDVTVGTALKNRREDFEGVHTCKKTETLFEIVDKIVRAEVHRLVVVDSDNVVQGIVSLSDILHYLVFSPLDERQSPTEFDDTFSPISDLDQTTSADLTDPVLPDFIPDPVHSTPGSRLPSPPSPPTADSLITPEAGRLDPGLVVDALLGPTAALTVDTRMAPTPEVDPWSSSPIQRALIDWQTKLVGEAGGCAGIPGGGGEMLLLPSPRAAVVVDAVVADKQLEVINEGEVLDTRKADDMDDFQMEVDWQRMQMKSEFEMASCGLP